MKKKNNEDTVLNFKFLISCTQTLNAHSPTAVAAGVTRDLVACTSVAGGAVYPLLRLLPWQGAASRPRPAHLPALLPFTLFNRAQILPLLTPKPARGKKLDRPKFQLFHF